MIRRTRWARQMGLRGGWLRLIRLGEGWSIDFDDGDQIRGWTMRLEYVLI